jgi:hypothetical protein
MAKPGAWRAVDPAHLFPLRARMETASRALAWINERLFFGTGARIPIACRCAHELL